MRFLNAFLLLLLAIPLHAQVIIGWNGGYANPRELNREIYIYNTVNASGLSKQMQKVHWYHGLVLGYGFGDDVKLEIIMVRRTCRVSSEFDSSGVHMTRQLKVQSNTLGFGISAKSGAFTYGGSLDFGGFKGKGRRGTADGIKDISFKRLWVVDNNFLMRGQMACTVFAGPQLGPVSLRFYLQLQFMRLIFDNLDPWLFGTRLNYEYWNRDKFSNAGVQLVCSLGKK